MNWIRGLGSSVWIGILGFLAAMAAASAIRSGAEAKKWQQKADDEKEADVQAGSRKAQQHLTQAKLAENKAAQAKQKATERIDQIGKKNETLAEVVAGWGTD